MNAAKTPPDELWVCHMGLVPYSDGLAIQKTLLARRQAGEIPDTLLLLEHPPVYTRGRRSAEGELPSGEDFYRAKGIEVIATDRGGRITYHGPGQLVGYPIMAITDVVAYVRTMENAISAALAQVGVEAHGRPQDGPDYTGVWVEDRKIASIGVHVAHSITTHGFAVNVENDLEPFSWVVACGLPDVAMTSLAAEIARRADMHRTQTTTQPARPSDSRQQEQMLERFRALMAERFCAAHGRTALSVPPSRLGIDSSELERMAA